MLRKMLAAALFLSACSLAGADVIPTLTGCIEHEKGVLYAVQAGSAPKFPCFTKDSQVSFNQVGPQGPAGPAGPVAPTPPRYRFVGVTTVHVNGAATWLGMTQACNSQFPGSRMAYSDEIKGSFPNIPVVAARAWVHPRPVVGSASGGGMDATGNYFSIDPCSSWTTTNPQLDGFAVGVNLDFRPAGCGLDLAIACAAPE